MKWWNRALASLRYRWKKNSLLLLVMILASSLVLPAWSVQEASRTSLKKVQEEIPAFVSMMKSQGNWDGTEEENYYSGELADAVAALPQVKRASHMTAVNVYSSRIRGIDVESAADWSDPDSWKERKTDPDTGEWIAGWMQVVGVTNLADYWDFRECGAQIVEGEGITEEDGEIMVLSQKVTSDNQIRLGETAGFQSFFDTDLTIEPKLAGVHNGKIWHGYGNAGDSVNFIYVPLPLALRLHDGIMESRYELRNPEELPAFLEAAEQLAEELGEDVTFVGDSIRYLTTSAALKNAGRTGTAVTAAVLLMAGLMITLLVGYSMWERTREMGILLSMGEKKSRLAGQMLLEMLLPVGAGMMISLILGKGMTLPLARLLTGATEGMETLSSGISGGSMGMVLGCGVFFTVVSMAVPMLSILRCRPAKMLRGN